MARAKSTSVEKWFNGFELQIYYSSLVRSKYARVSIVRSRRGEEGSGTYCTVLALAMAASDERSKSKPIAAKALSAVRRAELTSLQANGSYSRAQPTVRYASFHFEK